MIQRRIGLQPKQSILYNRVRALGTTVPTILGCGGARDGGKSGAARRIAVIHCNEAPGRVVFIIRRNYGDILENHIEKFRIDFPDLDDYWVAGKKEYSIPVVGADGVLGYSRIVFKYADTTDEVRKLSRGIECTLLIIDQAEQFSEDELIMIMTSNRWPDVEAGVCKRILFFNPGGPGTDYLRRVFWTKKYNENENPNDYFFVHLFGWDNFVWFRGQVAISEPEFYKLSNEDRFQMFITETSRGRAQNALPAHLRLGELLGSFEQFAGQYFAGVWDERKVGITIAQTERLIQKWWIRWMAFDWGFQHHSVNLWAATGKVSPTQLYEVLGIKTDHSLDVIICYREMVEKQMADVLMAQRIADMTPLEERRMIGHHFADSIVFAEQQRAQNTIAELMQPPLQDAGLPAMERADKDRIGGWRMVYEMLRRTVSMRSANAPNERLGGPLVMISHDCPNVLASMPMLICDPKRPEDVLKMPTLADDCGDDLRYLLKSYQQALVLAPRDIRAKELYHSITGQNEDDQMTARALAMRKFEIDNPKKKVLGKGRWRI